MFNYYYLTIGNGTQTHKLSYKLKQHRPAQAWAKLMCGTNPSELRKGHNIWYGIPQDPTPYVNELLGLMDQLNHWMPKKITHHWDSSNLQASANIFHTHFPEHKDDKNPVHRTQLERYNDLIHYIENIDRSNRFSYPAMHLLASTDKVELELDDYQYFSTYQQFGDLQLGYPHIGRHPIEIMWANDVDVPTDQILPQNLLSGFHWCGFYDSLSHVHVMEKFKKFYYNSKIQWPYELGDPRLAVGELNIGALELVNDQLLPREKILSLITSCNQVISWTIE